MKNSTVDSTWDSYFREVNEYIPKADEVRPKPYYGRQNEYAPTIPTPVPRTILITGERGSGKEMLAEQIAHAHGLELPVSARHNCAGWSEQLARSELFGYGPGAFTGALPRGKKGMLETSRIVFLDELHHLPIVVQAMLLRFVEYRELQPLGRKSCEAKSRPVIIAAVQPAALKDGEKLLPDLKERFGCTIHCKFSTAFQYRAHLLSIFLYENLIRANCTRKDIENLRIKPATLMYACLHDWPGGIRQFRRTVLTLKMSELIFADKCFNKYSTHSAVSGLHTALAQHGSTIDVKPFAGGFFNCLERVCDWQHFPSQWVAILADFFACVGRILPGSWSRDKWPTLKKHLPKEHMNTPVFLSLLDLWRLPLFPVSFGDDIDNSDQGKRGRIFAKEWFAISRHYDSEWDKMMQGHVAEAVKHLPTNVHKSDIYDFIKQRMKEARQITKPTSQRTEKGETYTDAQIRHAHAKYPTNKSAAARSIPMSLVQYKERARKLCPIK